MSNLPITDLAITVTKQEREACAGEAEKMAASYRRTAATSLDSQYRRELENIADALDACASRIRARGVV